MPTLIKDFVKVVPVSQEEKYWDIKRAGKGYILTPINLGKKTLMTPKHKSKSVLQ